ncbi:MAG TPA: SMC-Scp complex subunit ScpB, partial [Candidatus Binataceae bacterium]|nr:SMC-Scp complex subunit ScpB [Candidatus Binataceae bacterium]
MKAVLESLLFAAGEPVSIARIGAVLENVPREAIRKALVEMVTGLGAGGARGIVLEEVAGGYQLRTARENALYVRKLLSSKPPRLSRPLLETLAIIAYRQPITRPEIEQLRGVDTGGVIETLLERRFVRIAGRKEAPGRPIMYATTPDFLEVFGLKDLDGLPDLEEFKALEEGRAADDAEASEAAPAEEPAPESASGELADEARIEEDSGEAAAVDVAVADVTVDHDAGAPSEEASAVMEEKLSVVPESSPKEPSSEAGG